VPVGRFVVQGAGEAATQVPLGDGDTGLVEVGEVAFFVQRVRPGTVVGRQSLLAADRGLVAATAVGAFVLVGLVVTSQLLWDPTAEAGQRVPERRFLSVELRVAPERAEPAILDVADESAPGRRAAGEEGAFGRPDAPVETISRVPRRDGLLVDRIDPSRIALVDVLRRETIRTGALTDIVSDTALAFDNRMAVAMDGAGSELDLGFGAGGMGFKGTGPGGGGDTFGRIHGGGRIDGPGGPGHGVRAGLGPKAAARVVEVVGTGGSTTEFCDRNNIQRVVRMRAAAIRACYEQSLQVDEGLAGKVSVRWTIGGDGRVDGVSVLESTIGSAAVERCVLAAIRGMRFDPPTEGVCVVAWPFVFRADR
jgi:TonB family protein